MSAIVRIVSMADGTPCEHDGNFLVWWDVTANDGYGRIGTTPDPFKAYRFRDTRSALAAWHSIPANRPVRVGFDNKPNRPLTAFTIEVIDSDDPNG